MKLEKATIPYRGYWTSPFCRWQGSLGGIHSMELAAKTATAALSQRKIPPSELDGIVLGITVPQPRSFYGAPWLAGLIGAPGLSGQTVSQACATSVRILASAAFEIELGQRSAVLAVACDRTSNGPHMLYPGMGIAGGMGKAEDPVWDNFGHDPWAGGAMIDTAEKVARRVGISREQQDEMTALRFRQYEDSLAGDRAFQKRIMVPVELPKGKKEIHRIDTDEGIFPTTLDGLKALRPVQEGGSVTFGSQTHPADGNAGVLVTTPERARELTPDGQVVVRIRSFGEARVDRGMMPMAPVPAARQALERAGIQVSDCKAIKTHNPFAVNDVFLARELGVSPDAFNKYGSPLIYGHPQAPTGLRAIAELIEILVEAGGGFGLFTGCAAGDTAMAVVLEVG